MYRNVGGWDGTGTTTTTLLVGSHGEECTVQHCKANRWKGRREGTEQAKTNVQWERGRQVKKVREGGG